MGHFEIPLLINSSSFLLTPTSKNFSDQRLFDRTMTAKKSIIEFLLIFLAVSNKLCNFVDCNLSKITFCDSGIFFSEYIFGPQSSWPLEIRFDRICSKFKIMLHKQYDGYQNIGSWESGLGFPSIFFIWMFSWTHFRPRDCQKSNVTTRGQKSC